LLREVEKEVINLLSDLIGINTINSPGNVTKAVEYVTETL